MKNIFSFTKSVVLATFLSSSFSQASVSQAEQNLTNLIKNTKGANTDVVLVSKDGKMIYQSYARGYGPNMKSNVRVIDLLGMGSGIKYKEEYEGFPSDLDVTNMMYVEGQPMGFASYMVSRPLSPEGGPGEYYNYSSGDTNLLMAVLQKAINNQSVYNKYPWDKFFKPLGIDATFEQDIKGTFVGGSYFYMKATDFLKVGQLIANKGIWNGQQIIPQRYFELMSTVAEGVQRKVQKGNSDVRAYSAQVTTNLPACKEDLRAHSPVLPKLKIKNGNTAQAALGLGLFKRSRAVYRGKTFGCILTETEYLTS